MGCCCWWWCYLSPFEGWECRETLQRSKGQAAPRSEPEVADGKICTKDGAPKGLRCGIIQKDSKMNLLLEAIYHMIHAAGWLARLFAKFAVFKQQT